MSELAESLRAEFCDIDYRYAYDEEFANSRMAMQIKVLREARELKQAQLAELAGMKQSRISELENVNYNSWSINTLRRLARALGVRLSFAFESWAELLPEVDELSRASLDKPCFDDDVAFGSSGNDRAEPENSHTVLQFPVRTEIDISIERAGEQMLSFMFPHDVSRSKTRKTVTEKVVVTSSAGADNSFLNDETGGRIHVNQR